MNKTVSVHELHSGMIVSRDVFGASGQLLIKRGVSLTDTYIHYLKRRGIRHIEIEQADRPQPRQTGNGSGAPRTETDGLFTGPQYVASFRKELLDELPVLCRKVLISPGFSQADMQAVLEQLHAAIRKQEVLNGLFKIRLTGDTALQKAVQVAALSIIIGEKMGMDGERLDQLTIAALLYDIGNFWINRTLLAKPEVLNEREKNIIEEHTIIGYTVLREGFPEEVARVAYQHHERHNGSGYPCRAAGDEIDLFAKIVSICDVYMSLITPRPFRRKYEPIEALEYILGAGGTLFDPAIVTVFLEVIPLYSVGSMVELSNGCIGMVVETTGKPLGRPGVEILFDEKGQPASREVLDLTKHLTVSINRIL